MTTSSSLTDDRRCPGCGADNRCAIARGEPAQTCWCMDAASALPLPQEPASCYCSACLCRMKNGAHLHEPDIAR